MFRSISLYLLLIFTGLPVVQADYPLEIITLRSRPVDQVLPLVKPFVGTDGSVAGMHDKLIVRASPARLRDIYELLEQLDRPPRRLLIHVARETRNWRNRERLSASGSVKLGESTRVDVGHAKSTRPHIAARIQSELERNSLHSTQQVQTLEGQQAFIFTGTSFPVQQRQGVISQGAVHYGGGGYYSRSANGFYVLPRVNGDLVTLEISTQGEMPGGNTHTPQVERLRTSVSGRLGEWISIGNIDSQHQTTVSGILQHGQTATHVNQHTLLLVEEVD